MNNILVLMATYNGEKYLEDQIASIFSQENCKVSLLVSDDCSTDNTRILIKQLKIKYPDIRLLDNKIKHKSPGQNFYNLIMKSNINNYDYVAFSDQDDVFLNNKLYIQINRLSNTDFVASSSSVKCFGDSRKILKQSSDITSYDFFFEGAGQGCSFLMEASFFGAFQAFVKKN